MQHLETGNTERFGIPADPLDPIRLRSMAIARQLGSERSHSIAIDPAPAPTSHSSSPGLGIRRASAEARRSRLVSCPS